MKNTLETLQIEITQDEKFLFFEKYDTLSPLRKKIFQKTVWAVRTMVVAKPSQSKIAEWCECSRSAVSEAFKIFKEFGWLSLISRGYKKSKILVVPYSQQHIDVHNRQWFKRVEATHRATYTYTNNKRYTGRTGPVKKEPIEIPKLAQKLGYSRDSGLKLGLLPEYVVEETLYQAKKMGKNGFKPKNEEKYFVGIAINIAQKKGFKVDWNRYYENR